MPLDYIVMAIMLALPLASTAEAQELAISIQKTGDPLRLDQVHAIVRNHGSLKIVSLG